MLKSAGFELPKTIYGHGFITINGEKISKSRGNVVRPTELTEKYGVDPVRYYFIKFGPWIEDTDISIEKLEEVYNSDLANGLGNLVSRVARLCENSSLSFPVSSSSFYQESQEYLENYSPQLAIEYVWLDKIQAANKYIDNNKPWELSGEKLKEVLTHLVTEIRNIAYNIKPFLPETADKIEGQYGKENISAGNPLFPRI
jgi:methionyl-tRNA synthetase